MNNIGVGGYHFSYEQSDGQKREETAELKNEGTDNEAMSVVGSFSFIAPDGHTYRYAKSGHSNEHERSSGVDTRLCNKLSHAASESSKDRLLCASFDFFHVVRRTLESQFY